MTSAPAQIFSFRGGLKLPADANRALDLPILDMPLPEKLVYPLLSRSGNQRRALVSVGDTVATGQTLAVSDNDHDVPLLASADGVIEFIDANIHLHTQMQQPQQQPQRLKGSSAERLHALAVQGLGGAAFSSSAKLLSGSTIIPSASPSADNQIRTLIINAAECEPMICCDQALMREHAMEIVHGIAELANLLAVERCLIGIEDSMHAEIRLLSDALAQLARQSPSTGNPVDKSHELTPGNKIAVVSIPTIYPTGGERQLIRVLTGIDLAASRLPRDEGILCFNVATAFAVKRALLDHCAQTDRIVTVTGSAITEPRNVRARFGTRLVDLLTFVNPAFSHHDCAQLEVLQGGPMTGIPVQAEHGSISAASNCVIANQPAQPNPVLPCIRCGECDKVCPARLLPQQLHWFCRADNLADAEKFNLSACIECGCCDYVCPSNIALTAQFRRGKIDTAEQSRLETLATRAQQRFDLREQRLERKAQARQLRLQQRKEALEKKRKASTATRPQP